MSISPELAILSTERDGDAVLEVEGEIDMSSAPALDAVMASLDEQQPRLVVDLRKVGFIDSTGLCILLRAHRRLEEEGRRLVLADPSPAVRRLLDITGLSDVVDVRCDRSGHQRPERLVGAAGEGA